MKARTYYINMEKSGWTPVEGYPIKNDLGLDLFWRVNEEQVLFTDVYIISEAKTGRSITDVQYKKDLKIETVLQCIKEHGKTIDEFKKIIEKHIEKSGLSPLYEVSK